MANPWGQKLHQQNSVDVSCTCHEAEEKYNDHNPVYKTSKKKNVLTWYQIKKERGIKFVNNIKKLDWNSVIWNCKYITWSIAFFLEWFNILTV